MKIDTSNLKKTVDLFDWAGRYTVLKRKGKKEKYGSCPKCKGNDRFFVKEDDTGQWFHCRVCGAGGDIIKFIQWVESVDFLTACGRLAGANLPTLPAELAQATKPIHLPKILTPPGLLWQTRARAFTEYAQKLLWQPKGKPGLDYLHSRGFTTETIRTAGLGFNLRDINDSPEKWGVKDKPNIWLPGPGIVIPWLIGDDYWRLNIRLLEVRRIGDKELRYIGPAGWRSSLYGVDALSASRPAILCEGELDALTIKQYAGDIITPVSTGTTAGSRQDKWIARLAACPLVLIAFDAESAGDKAAQFWLDTLPNAKRWRPFWKDANAMAHAGVDIRSWIEATLPVSLHQLLSASGSVTPARPSNFPLSYWPGLVKVIYKITYPKIILWPADTPTTGDEWVRDLDTGQLRVTYNTPESLEASIWAIAMVQEALTLGGKVMP